MTLLEKQPHVRKKPRSKRRGNAYNFDWENMPPDAFGDANTSYKRQAGFYASQAMHLARAYPLKWVSASKITEKEIQAVRDVARAWSELADELAQRSNRKVSSCA